MNQFLYQVADYLMNKQSHLFKQMVLVFPNRRSGVFFLNYLKQLAQQPVWLPNIKTINEFIQDFSTVQLAEPLELLADLYKIYGEVSKSKESFDDFFHWGEMMLSDFDDVDKYRVDPKGLFTNITELKKFDQSFDFLTEEQIEVIRNFFIAFNPEERSALKDKFLEIWQVLHPVYEQFNQTLKAKGIGYEGMVYRESVSRVLQMNVKDFDFNKVYFIGFNAITKCEEELFEHLKQLDIARFFWDYDKYYIENPEQEAGLFLRKYLKKFPSPDWDFSSDNLTHVPKQIKLISASTDHSQVYYASQLLQKLNSNDYSNTALVLSDEQLLLPALNYLPDKVGEVNVTMGYPVKDSLAGNLVDLLIQLQLNRRGKDLFESSFSHQQVIPLLRHPYLSVVSGSDLIGKATQLVNENLYLISKADLGNEPLVDLIFQGISDSAGFVHYLKEVFAFIQSKLTEQVEQSVHYLMDLEFMHRIYLGIDRFHQQFERVGFDISLPVFTRLLRKVVQSIKVPFEGEPVKGLQIMGFLETRNLDFDQVIILSVNEGKLPSSGAMPSFIPYSLRKGFGLPTREMHDAMYAYYFYRLIQRAGSVYLFYNSAGNGLNTGEKSRFAYQLIYNPLFSVEQETRSQTIQVMTDEPIIVEKKGLVRERLLEYLTPDSEKKLSPSAIKTYLTCPLRFYYRSVLYLNELQDIDDTVDSRMFGNLFHLSAQKMYQSFYENQTEVTEAELERLAHQTEKLDAILRESFTEAFLGEQTKRTFEIKGKNLLVIEVIKKYLHQLIEIDKQRIPFSVVGLEQKLDRKAVFHANGEKYEIKIGGQIDRVDRTSLQMQIIDYKTGADKLIFKQLEDLFSPELISDTKAVLQTFIYSWVCALHYPNEQVIVPLVYQVKKFFEDGKLFAVQSSEDVRFQDGNFKSIEAAFGQLMENLLAELFNWNIPFSQTGDTTRCVHCPYRLLCRK